MTAIAARRRRPWPAPVSWRRLAWVGWRQQRAIVLASLAVMSGAALILVLSGVPIHHTAARLGPGWWIRTRPAGYYNWVQQLPWVLQALPILIGAFAGAPLLARQAEAGTFRFAWTQGAGRLRLLAVQLLPMVVILGAAAAGLGALYAWWFAPLTGDVSMVRYGMSTVDLFAPSLAGWVVLSVLLGVLAGAVLRQTVTAMGVTMASYVAVAYVAAEHLRSHYLAPLAGPAAAAGGPATQADVLSNFYAWPGGKPLAAGDMTQSTSWFSQHHIAMWAVYQPASRFWPFQWIELGWLAALSLVLAGGIVLIVRRRPV